MPKLSKQQAISLLRRQMNAVVAVQGYDRDSAEFSKWQRDTEITIEQIFGGSDRHIKDFRGISYSPGVIGFNEYGERTTSDGEFRRRYENGLNKARTILQSMVEEIQTYWADDAVAMEAQPNPQTAGQKVELICTRFPAVVRQLRRRYGNRNPLEINDEYDVQDLMRALLQIFFDDVRPEQWTPSYAGKSARMDFLLKMEHIVLEIKHGRRGLTEKELGDELIIDIRRYKETHPDCQALYCFIFDPQGFIDNPNGMENDLSKITDGVPVKVIIAPRQL
jgi:hypothetical protein